MTNNALVNIIFVHAFGAVPAYPTWIRPGKRTLVQLPYLDIIGVNGMIPEMHADTSV